MLRPPHNAGRREVWRAVGKAASGLHAFGQALKSVETIGPTAAMLRCCARARVQGKGVFSLYFRQFVPHERRNGGVWFP